ncbi:uncharacterized protein [Nicotiana tomentosiformis]|uniref:uncharacterized protein n=1 Tax=Nicotiana tomentosiformis TaxID=4098 RepID=UPI00388C488F
MGTPETFSPDPSNPLFVHSSDIPGISLVPVPFSGSGFRGWKRKMIVALSAKNKIAFVNGTCIRPTISGPQQKYGTYLQARYETTNRANCFELKRELAYTSQGALDIASYFNKLKKLWDELGVICTNHAQRCICAAKPGIQQEDEENKPFQFLMGLNEVYVGVRRNFLMMHPPPTLNSAYNILLNDEKQRQVSPNSQFIPDSMSFNVNTTAKMGPHPSIGPVPAFNHSSPPPRQYPQRINFY